MNSPGDVTKLLGRLQAGDAGAADALLALLHAELRKLARAKLSRERPGHTLQATALAHDAFLRLVGQDRVQWQSRAHFLSVAALAMRRILINHAKARLADKRGGGGPMVTFEEHGLGRPMQAEDMLALDDALTDLAANNDRQASVVIYRFFGGLAHEEIAEVMGVSVPTVRRDWRFARAWLLRELSRDR